jgi:LuxR family quorum-sensing transcriptional regulator LasR
MKTIEDRLEELFAHRFHDNMTDWRDWVFQWGRDFGYRHAAAAIFPSHDTPIETCNAYLQTNLPSALLCKYDEEKMGEVDPVALHCMAKSTPLVWSSDTFSSSRQLQLYEEACSHDIRSGIAFPYHGPNGEFGMLCYATEERLDPTSAQEVARNIPELSCFRDVAMEAYSGFMRRGPGVSKGDIEITSRELECLKWCAVGKSSWDIANLMNCTEATVNYHFSNIRRKFGASSRRMAVIKAIRWGFLTL